MTTPALPTPHPSTTARDLLRYTVSRFTTAGLVLGHGNEDAYNGVAYLTLHMLYLPIDTLGPLLDTRLLPEEVVAVLKVIRHRAVDHVPAAYIAHGAFMYDTRPHVDECATVPHSFIGELLGDGLKPQIDQENGPIDVLGLCTGSGYLSIPAALQWPNSVIDTVDLSPDTLVVANHNVDKYHLQGRICLHEGDLYVSLPPGVHCNMIPTNPPYVNEASVQASSLEYRAEPHMALVGGNDGANIVRRIPADAPRHLRSHGMLVMEIGNKHENVEAASPDLDLVWLPTNTGEDQVLLVTHEAF